MEMCTKLKEGLKRKCFNCHATETSGTWNTSKLSHGKVVSIPFIFLLRFNLFFSYKLTLPCQLCGKCSCWERAHACARPKLYSRKRDGPASLVLGLSKSVRSQPQAAPPIRAHSSPNVQAKVRFSLHPSQSTRPRPVSVSVSASSPRSHPRSCSSSSSLASSDAGISEVENSEAGDSNDELETEAAPLVRSASPEQDDSELEAEADTMTKTDEVPVLHLPQSPPPTT